MTVVYAIYSARMSITSITNFRKRHFLKLANNAQV